MGSKMSISGMKAREHYEPFYHHPLKDLQECYKVFVDKQLVCEKKATKYPYFLDLEEFEEIFGLLLEDVGSHFLLLTSYESHTVNAYHAFLTIAILAKAELRLKLEFIVHLFAATSDPMQVSCRTRRRLLRDYMAVLQRIIQLRNRSFNACYKITQKKLAMTIESFCDFCLSSPLITGYLYDIETITNELYPIQCNHTISFENYNSQIGMNFSSDLVQLLWKMKVYDFPFFWKQLCVQATTVMTYSSALQLMDDSKSDAITIIDSKQNSLIGALSRDDLVEYLYLSLKAEALFVSDGISINRLFDSVRKISQVHLSVVYESIKTKRMTNEFDFVYENEPFLNVILRFAAGLNSITVMPDDSTACTEHVQIVCMNDALEWILGQTSRLFDMKQYQNISYPIPGSMSHVPLSSTDMAAKRLTELLVFTERPLASRLEGSLLRNIVDEKCDAELVLCVINQYLYFQNEKAFIPKSIGEVACTPTSIPIVLQLMAKSRATHVYIIEHTREIKGIIHASSVLNHVIGSI